MATELYITSTQVPQIRDGKRVGSIPVNWEERQYRRQLHSNGYFVTLATIIIPSINKVVVGASACSPEDQFYFSRKKGADKALGRARQQATKLLNGSELLPSLVGGPADCVFELGEWNPGHLKAFSETVAHNAEVQSLMKDFKRLRRKYPAYRIESLNGGLS